MKPDDWIEDFLYRAYTDELLEYKYMCMRTATNGRSILPTSWRTLGRDDGVRKRQITQAERALATFALRRSGKWNYFWRSWTETNRPISSTIGLISMDSCRDLSHHFKPMPWKKRLLLYYRWEELWKDTRIWLLLCYWTIQILTRYTDGIRPMKPRVNNFGFILESV